MPPIRIGSTEVSKIYVGSTEIGKAYLGENQVFGSSTAARTIWFIHVNGSAVNLRGYNANTRMRDTSKDLSLTLTIGSDTIVSDGSTLWVVPLIFSGNTNIMAYNAGDLTRDTSKDFTATGLINIRGSATDGTTIWLFSGRNGRAYTAATGARDSGKDFRVVNNVSGATCDGTTIFFSGDGIIFGWNVATRTIDRSKDITVTIPFTNSRGIATDGTTLWMISSSGNTARAFDIATRARDSGKDIVIGSPSPGYWAGAT